MHMLQSRPDFLTLSAAGGAGILGPRRSRADERQPETTTIQLLKESAVCDAPLYVAEELLRADGSSPNALLAAGADWRFLNELKRELKA
jgi:NitT/TauT family transport system substrate-binding protein